MKDYLSGTDIFMQSNEFYGVQELGDSSIPLDFQNYFIKALTIKPNIYEGIEEGASKMFKINFAADKGDSKFKILVIPYTLKFDCRNGEVIINSDFENIVVEEMDIVTFLKQYRSENNNNGCSPAHLVCHKGFTYHGSCGHYTFPILKDGDYSTNRFDEIYKEIFHINDEEYKELFKDDFPF